MALYGFGATERTRLLSHASRDDIEAPPRRTSTWNKDESALAGTSVGERLPYSDYTTIDWLHDLVRDSYRFRAFHSSPGLRGALYSTFDACSGWIAVTIVGVLMAFVACIIDVAQATISGYKYGYCAANPFLSREECCRAAGKGGIDCEEFTLWADAYWTRFAAYIGWAALFGIISSSVTMLSKRALPWVAPGDGHTSPGAATAAATQGKSLYMSAGSGIPEIKTILSGFVIPHFLDLEILFLKGLGAIFAVATGMALGKEGPFVHIAACVGQFVANRFAKYQENGRKTREVLTAACAAGLSAAFGTPIGGVLFAYEEISTYFPKKVLWRTFLCSMVASMTLRALNPHKTGKLVLFETNYGTRYRPEHYLIFALIGVAGGLWGGTFCKANHYWAKWFRRNRIIKNYPVLEVFIVIMITAALQFPNPVTRAPGDIIIRHLLVNCEKDGSSWVCQNEARTDGKWDYIGWLGYGTLAQLISTTITFGIKVPAGIIIPALDAGVLFGRLVGQFVPTISPGIFAMVGAGAFLGGVSRMTLSLCVIMFELTGELEFVIPHMVAILAAKWTADALSRESVYDLAQSVLGHPFLDEEHALTLVQHQPSAVIEELLPPPHERSDLTISIPKDNKVPRRLLKEKLSSLHRLGLLDGGLILVQNGVLQGYISESELDHGINELGKFHLNDSEVTFLGPGDENDLDLSMFVDRSPVCICSKAPMEVAVEMFSKLGVRYVILTEEGTGNIAGAVMKRQLLSWLDGLKKQS